MDQLKVIKADITELKNTLLGNADTRTKEKPMTIRDCKEFLKKERRERGYIKELKALDQSLVHYDSLSNASVKLCGSVLELIELLEKYENSQRDNTIKLK